MSAAHRGPRSFSSLVASLKQLLPTPRSTPVSFALLTVIVIFAVLARIPALQAAIHSTLTFAWGQLENGRVWTPFTALLVPGRLDGLLLQILILALVIPTLERRFGRRHLAVAFFGIGGVANLLGGLLIIVLARAGEPWAGNAGQLLRGDPSVGLVAALASYVAAAPPVWRNRGFVILGSYVAVMLAYSGQPNDVARAIAFGLGWIVGEWVAKRRQPHHGTHRFFSPGHEIRVMGATFVTMLAFGPVVSVVSRASQGILSPSLVLVDNDAYLAHRAPCSVLAVGRTCGDWLVWGLQSHHRTTAWIQLLPVVLLLIAAVGLMRGRRSAVWISAVMLLRNAAGVGVTFLGRPHGPTQIEHVTTSMQRVELIIQVTLVIAVNLVVALWLIHNRRSFEVRLSRRGAALGWSVAVATVIGTAVAVVMVGTAVHGRLQDPPGFGRLVASGLALPLPPSARIGLGVALRTTSWESKVPLLGIEAAMWCILIVLTYRVVTYGLWRSGPSAAQVRERLRIGGGSHLAFMATWPGNSLWQDPVSGAIVAYRSVAGIALTLSQPFGAPRVSLRELVERFNEFADTQGLTPVWYSVDAAEFDPIVRELGWQSVEVAQESIVDVQEWRTVGKAWQDVRSALSRAGREGITAEWTSWHDMTVGAYTQIVALSQDWVSDHPLPEMGFTLGGLDQLHDPDVRLMVAMNESGRVEGVLSWLPTWRDGVVVGWTLDFMRRRSDSMPGLIEFLIAQSAMLMKEQGIEFMSLSGAPLAGTESDGDSTQLDALLQFVSETLEPVYGFQSLHRFKQKFQPEVRAWAMVFPSALDLPAIGLAVTRSYLPHLSVTEAARAMRELAAGR